MNIIYQMQLGKGWADISEQEAEYGKANGFTVRELVSREEVEERVMQMRAELIAASTNLAYEAQANAIMGFAEALDETGVFGPSIVKMAEVMAAKLRSARTDQP